MAHPRIITNPGELHDALGDIYAEVDKHYKIRDIEKILSSGQSFADTVLDIQKKHPKWIQELSSHDRLTLASLLCLISDALDAQKEQSNTLDNAAYNKILDLSYLSQTLYSANKKYASKIAGQIKGFIKKYSHLGFSYAEQKDQPSTSRLTLNELKRKLKNKEPFANIAPSLSLTYQEDGHSHLSFMARLSSEELANIDQNTLALCVQHLVEMMKEYNNYDLLINEVENRDYIGHTVATLGAAYLGNSVLITMLAAFYPLSECESELKKHLKQFCSQGITSAGTFTDSTPLMFAASGASGQHLELVKLLVEGGADITQKIQSPKRAQDLHPTLAGQYINRQGWTAWDFAYSAQAQDVQEFLESRMQETPDPMTVASSDIVKANKRKKLDEHKSDRPTTAQASIKKARQPKKIDKRLLKQGSMMLDGVMKDYPAIGDFLALAPQKLAAIDTQLAGCLDGRSDPREQMLTTLTELKEVTQNFKTAISASGFCRVEEEEKLYTPQNLDALPALARTQEFIKAFKNLPAYNCVTSLQETLTQQQKTHFSMLKAAAIFGQEDSLYVAPITDMIQQIERLCIQMEHTLQQVASLHATQSSRQQSTTFSSSTSSPSARAAHSLFQGVSGIPASAQGINTANHTKRPMSSSQ